MRSMRMPPRAFTISWLLLVAMLGAVGLTRAAIDTSGEKIGDFLKYADGTALDTRTNLMWMTKDFRNLEGRAPKSWDEAMAWAEKMNQQRYGGYSDWRVPTEAEYKTLYDPRRSKKSYDNQPVGYPEAFEDGGGEGFWTGETSEQASATTNRSGVDARGRSRVLFEAYGFDFRSGRLLQRPLKDTRDDLSIRLVRTGLPRAQGGIAVLKSH